VSKKGYKKRVNEDRRDRDRDRERNKASFGDQESFWGRVNIKRGGKRNYKMKNGERIT
jgi:hypothetical protein